MEINGKNITKRVDQECGFPGFEKARENLYAPRVPQSSFQ